jgi:hypothetical protein
MTESSEEKIEETYHNGKLVILYDIMGSDKIVTRVTDVKMIKLFKHIIWTQVEDFLQWIPGYAILQLL